MIGGHEENQRAEWERTRALAFIIARSNSDPKRFPKTLQKFWPFDWDSEHRPQVVNINEIRKQHAANKALREQLEKKATK